MKKFAIFFLIFIIPLGVFCDNGSVSSSYTYDYSSPPEFQPSLNSQFTSLSCGVTDVLANPAGLMQVNTFEVAVGASAFVSNPIKSDRNTVYVDDQSVQGIQNSPNSRAYIRLTNDRTAVTPEARPLNIDEDYSKGGGINYFGATYKVNDWLAFAITRKRPTAISFDYQMMAPVMADVKANFRGTSVEAGGQGNYIQIRSDGTIEAVIGGITLGTSKVPAWSGFLDQGTSEANDVEGTFDDSITNQDSVVLSAAVQTGQVSWGLNVMPMTYDIEMNNEMSVQSDPGNSNLTVYIPNLDFGSTQDAINWVTQECGSPTGYRTLEVETLAGQQIGAAKVAGKYTGTVVRMDLGFQWNPNDYFSMGAVYENFNHGTLQLEGVDVIQYVEHRVDVNAKVPTFEGTTYYDPFLSTPTHEVETENTIRSALTFQPIELPVKLKFGVALKKPVLLAVDWEQWQNEYSFSSHPSHPDTAHYITISNINFIKVGGETQLFFLPIMLRGSITGLIRPETDDKSVDQSLDDLYKNTPVVPVDGNIYLGFGVLDGELGVGVGGGGLPLLQAVMFDMSSIAKVFYSNIYYKKGNWQVSYLMTMDPVLTGFSSDISTTPGTDSDIKLMSTSTLSIGVKF